MTVSSRGVLLAEDRGAGEVLQRLCAGVLGVLLHEEAEAAHEVRLGEVDGLLALLRGGHAGDNHVDLAVVEGVDQAGEAHLDGNGLHAERLADDLCELDVVAVRVRAVHVLDGDGVLGLLRGLPVVRAYAASIPTRRVLPSPRTPVSDLEEEEEDLSEVPCAAGPHAVRKVRPAAVMAVMPETFRKPRRESCLAASRPDAFVCGLIWLEIVLRGHGVPRFPWQAVKRPLPRHATGGDPFPSPLQPDARKLRAHCNHTPFGGAAPPHGPAVKTA